MSSFQKGRHQPCIKLHAYFIDQYSICKVLEYIITTNVVSHMDKYNLLYDLQHGFRSKRSCETQLVTLIEDMMQNTTAGSQPCLTDVVDHEILLQNLALYGNIYTCQCLPFNELLSSNCLHQPIKTFAHVTNVV